MGIKIEKNLQEYAISLKKELYPVMQQTAAYLHSGAMKKINSNIKPENAPLTQAVKKGDKTLRDSGALLASLNWTAFATGAKVSTNLRYAKFLQTGGVIRGKRKGLWIPASAKTREMFRRYGTQKPGELIALMKNDKYTFRYNDTYTVFFCKKKRAKEFILFFVKKTIIIPPRPFLYISVQEELYIMRTVENSVLKNIKEAKRGIT